MHTFYFIILDRTLRYFSLIFCSLFLSFYLNCSQLSEYSEDNCKEEYNHIKKQLTDRLITTHFSSKDQLLIDQTILQLLEADQKRSKCSKGRI